MNGTKVEMDAAVAEHSPVRDIDLVAILANVFENAIHGAGQSRVADAKIKMSIRQKGRKLVIQCRNTIWPGQRFEGDRDRDGKHPQDSAALRRRNGFQRGRRDVCNKDFA